MVEIERLEEGGGLRDDRLVEALEGYLNRPSLHAHPRQERFERDALPARVAHRSVRQLPAGDARLEEGAAVAAALIDRDNLDGLEAGLEVGERKGAGLIDLAADLEAERIRIDRLRQAGEMVTDKKGVVRGQNALVEDAERRLKTRRPGGQPDQRPLARIGDERALAIPDRERDRLVRRGGEKAPPKAYGTDAGSQQSLQGVSPIGQIYAWLIHTAELHAPTLRPRGLRLILAQESEANNRATLWS